MYLRIGRAYDNSPKVIRHVIARRNKSGSLPVYREGLLVPLVEMTPELAASMEEAENAIKTCLESCITRIKRKRYLVPRHLVSEFNQRSKPQKDMSDWCDWDWTKVEENQDFVIGEEALHLKPDANFNIHWPIRRGQLNLHSGVGGSLSSVLADLEDIWTAAIQNHLNISPTDLKAHKAVLVIPDIYNRQHVRELINLLLNKMGFMCCFIHLESVCATFGGGIINACVVDVGDQTTTISCVDEGTSLEHTRICMNYGGNDITQLFHWLQKRDNFPCELSSENTLDALLMEELKEKFCHLNINIVGALDKSFTIRRPMEHVTRYKIKVGDEVILAPLGLFYPEFFGITGPKYVKTMPKNEGLPDDPLDESYLAQIQKKSTKDPSESPMDQSFSEEAPSSSSAVAEDLGSAAAAASDMEQNLNFDRLLGIHEAMIQSIESIESDELKLKMYNNILYIGAGLKFDEFCGWITKKFKPLIPEPFRERFSYADLTKFIKLDILVWTGAALMSGLDLTQELWITQSEWEKYSVKILREKAPFTF